MCVYMCTHIVQCMLAHFRLALSLIPRPLPVYVNGAEFALLTYDRCPDLHAGHIVQCCGVNCMVVNCTGDKLSQL